MKEIQNRALKSTPRTNMTMSAVVRKHEGNSENDWCLASTHKLPKSLSLASCFSEKSRSATGSQAWPEISSSDLPVIALSSRSPCVARAAVGAGAHPLRRQKPPLLFHQMCFVFQRSSSMAFLNSSKKHRNVFRSMMFFFSMMFFG